MNGQMWTTIHSGLLRTDLHQYRVNYSTRYPIALSTGVWDYLFVGLSLRGCLFVRLAVDYLFGESYRKWNLTAVTGLCTPTQRVVDQEKRSGARH
jgi:hypothetical protein